MLDRSVAEADRLNPRGNPANRRSANTSPVTVPRRIRVPTSACMQAALAIALLSGCGDSATSPPNEDPVNRGPAASITAPVDGAKVIQGQVVVFAGAAMDPDEGPLPASALVWHSNADGQLGTGASFSRSDLSAGVHTIRLTATDSHGASGSASVTLTVEAAPQKGWVTMGSPFPDNARQVALGASGSNLFLFLGWTNPALPTLEQARIEEWIGTGWNDALFRTNDGDRNFAAAALGNRGAVVWNDRTLRLGRALKASGGSWGGFTISSLTQRTSPAVTFALDEAFFAHVQLGRMHVFTLASGVQPELDGGLGQTSNACVLVNDCIRDIALTGDASAWYAAVGEPGCISVRRGSREDNRSVFSWLGGCFYLNGNASKPLAAMLQGQPVVAFREGGGTELVVARWNGSQWTLLRQETIGPTGFVRLASDGGVLYVLLLDPTSPNPGARVLRYDGQWSQVGGQIVTLGVSLSPRADIAVYQGQPVVSLIEGGRAVVKRYVPE